MKKVYQEIASQFSRLIYCQKQLETALDEKVIDRLNTNSDNAQETIENICKNYLPSGSGFDSGTHFNYDLSKVNQKLVFNSGYHHMNENGYYNGWSELIITVKPSFDGFDIRITGIRRKNSCDSEYFYDTFIYALNKEVAK